LHPFDAAYLTKTRNFGASSEADQCKRLLSATGAAQHDGKAASFVVLGS
jgi:hypothetical protein